MKKIGFIGCGNMANAMISGILASGALKPAEIIASNHTLPKLKIAHKNFGIDVTPDNKKAASESEILVLAVKPQICKDVIKEISSAVPENCIVVTLAAGMTIAQLEELFGRPVKLIRAMPNTPALVREGMTALCPGKTVTPVELEQVRSLFESFGRAETVSENMMDAVTAVSGSSPAYVFMFIEAMADAAVMGGMPRNKAYTFAAQSVFGSAKMLLETGKHPGELKDMVCSPAGTTIEAVATLEKDNFRGAVIDAMQSCMKKSKSI
ncbi:MAG TPA: pyrroline-5-carboxylate reductase [Ruminococcaceae bacterium]|jgi:pyrroline-5-carboxylate reductase|nr:pyrroline-5-carboxylate reductase [Oscillospiraceae bacterium]